MELGEKLRKIRLEKGYTQNKVADKAGISNTYLSDIEVGRTYPSLKTLFSISLALGVDCKNIISDINTTKNKINNYDIRYNKKRNGEKI